MKKTWSVACLVAIGLLAGCNARRTDNSTEAIRKAIEARLSGRQGLASDQIVMEMQDVQVKGDTAEADVVFHSRNDPRARMSFHYQLRKSGGTWEVQGGRPSSDSSPHPGGAPQGEQGTQELPPGHPPVTQ